MVKPSFDPELNDSLPDFGIYNDEEGYYKKYRTDVCETDAIYIIKANAPINTEAHANAQSNLLSGKVKFLIDEREAKQRLLSSLNGANMTPEERQNYLMPFTLTSILREEMLEKLAYYIAIYNRIPFNCEKLLKIFGRFAAKILL